MPNASRDKVFKIIKIMFPLILFALATLEIRKFASDINVDVLRHEVSELDAAKLFLIFFIPFCAIFPMFFYDTAIVKILGLNVPARLLVKQSFIANTFSNLIGFGGLVGAMLRTYFYHKYEMDNQKLVRIITFVSLFYLTGISLLSWIIIVGYRDFPLLSDRKWLSLAVLSVGIYLPVFTMVNLFRNKRGRNVFNDCRVGVNLFFVSLLEWTTVFLVIWFLAIIFNVPIRFSDLVPVFIIASCAGIVSMIPGGLGSFDLVFIWGTEYLGIQDEKVLALLLFYRLGYFVLPFFFGVVLFVKEYWDKWNKSWNNLPNSFIQSASHVLLTLLIFISGLVLLLSASVPGIMERVKIIQEFLSFPIVNISHQLSVAAGFVLLGLSRGIEYKVNRAYQLSIIVLSFAVLFSLMKGIDYEESIFLLIVLLLLRISKKRFYRESYVLTWGKTIFDITLVVIITSMYLFIGYTNLPTSKINIPRKLQPYMIMDYQDLFYSALIGLIIAFFILVIGYLSSKPQKWKKETSKDQEEKILEHINTYKGNVLTHLIFLHDKYVFWNKKKTVLFSYQKYADKLVVLGDPIGEKADFRLAIEELLEISDLHGYTPVFYQVSDALFPYLHENGYAFFKLGEEAFVNLTNFSLSGKKKRSFRAIKNKFEREHYHFEIVKPPFDSSFLNELKEISDLWLQGRREKGFSLGFFDEDYLNRTEIAIVKSDESRIIGFSNIMPVYDQNQTISVDLMRFRPDAPSGTMDFILLSLFEWAKANNYQYFNLGMAPLSNVGHSRFSFLSEKIASQIFFHGQFFYPFQGLKRFKEKYADDWQPKYFAYRKNSSLPFTMAQITLLIGKKRK